MSAQLVTSTRAWAADIVVVAAATSAIALQDRLSIVAALTVGLLCFVEPITIAYADRALGPWPGARAVTFVAAGFAAGGLSIAFLFGGLTEGLTRSETEARAETVFVMAAIALLSLPAIWEALGGNRRPGTIFAFSSVGIFAIAEILNFKLLATPELLLGGSAVVGGLIAIGDSIRHPAPLRQDLDQASPGSTIRSAIVIGALGIAAAIVFLLDIAIRH